MARTTTSRKSEGSERPAGPVAAMDFLLKKRCGGVPGVVAVAGDAAFLRRQVLLRVRDIVLGDDLNDFTYLVHSGEDIRPRDVFDDLWTPPMLGERRLVVVQPAERKPRRRTEDSAPERKVGSPADKSDEHAESKRKRPEEAARDRSDDSTDEDSDVPPVDHGDFISQNRSALEKYVAQPSPSAVLLLDLRSFPANTKLYKAIQQSGLIVDCVAAKPQYLAAWCRQWAAHAYGKELPKDAADWLVELAGPDYGVLDQELRKLSTFVGDAGAIAYEVVQRLSAGAGDDKAFKILDAALDGDIVGAIRLLDRQLAAGDPPQRLLNIASSQVRKLTRAARLAVAGTHSLRQALAAAGVPPFAIDRSEARLKRIGRERMAGMFRRLLSADLAVKGGSGLDPSAVLLRLIRDLAVTDAQTRVPVIPRLR